MSVTPVCEPLDPPAPPAPPVPRGAAPVGVVCLFFILSGACGLGYEVIWARYLGLFLGNTVLVHTAVLGTFMGGMALGSLLLGRRAEWLRQPLKAYGWLELAIAAYACVFPTLAGGAQGLVIAAAQVLPPGSPGLLAVRLLLGVALLALPTVLMGATFPALTARLERTDGLGARGANWLYCANCAGAVAGALLCGFWLIPAYGLAGTMLAVALANVAVGAAALLAGFRDAPLPAPPSGPSENGGATSSSRLVLAAICLSGAAAFIYELVWTRLFAIALGSSTYSFTLMLAAFISGLAFGSLAAQFLPGLRRAPLTWLAGAEVLIGLAVALSLPLYPRLPYWFWQWRWLLRPVPETVGLYHTLQYALAFLVMLAPTFLFGLTFPTAIRAAARRGGEEEHVSAHAAAVYGWNTLGTLLGVTAAGAVLIPALGLRGTLLFAAALNLALGAVLAVRGGLPLAPRRILLAAAALAGVLLLGSPGWQPGGLTYSSFRSDLAPPASWKVFQERVGQRRPVFYEEDLGTTVAVVNSVDLQLGAAQHSLIVDGKADATSVGDMPTQAMLAHAPLFLKPDAEDVFILGLGSGVTAGSALTHPVKRVDCVEISQAVARASRHFEDVNGRPQSDPRFHLLVDDGKTVLASTRRRYDVIISEPTNPWISGVGNLFSQEAFQAAARKLKPGGLAAQWFHTYQLDDALVATILRTFRSVFPHVLVFQGNATDYILIGSLQPLPVDFGRMEARLREPRVARDLERIGITHLTALLGMQTHTGDAAARLAEGGGLNTDDFPLLEHRAPHALYVGATAKKIQEADSRFRPGAGLLLEHYFRLVPARRGELAALDRVLADPRTGDPALRFRLLSALLRRRPRDPELLLALSGLMEGNGRTEQALAYARRAAALGPGEAAARVTRLEGRLRSLERSAFDGS